MKFKVVLFVFTILFSLLIFYYFYPRSLKFSLCQTIDSNFENMDSVFFQYNYISSQNIFVAIFKENGYDSSFVNILCKQLDFSHNDYIVTYHKEVMKLSFSPYLRKYYDNCRSLSGTPLIPTYKTDYKKIIYIYRIKKNHKYRGICG